MTNATKSIKNTKASMRNPLATSPHSVELPNGMRDRILEKAFELWRARGYRDGHDLEDWLDAEAIVKGDIREARE